MSNTTLLGSYSPEDVVCVISNDKFSHTISGFADGSFLNLSRIIPASTLYTGGDGTNCRVIRDVSNLDVTFTLHQSSESNDVLSHLLVLDMAARDSSELFSILIRDMTGRTVISTPTCFIGSNPDVPFETDISTRDWVLHTIGSSIHIGGNARFTSGGFDALVDLGATVDQEWNPATP